MIFSVRLDCFLTAGRRLAHVVSGAPRDQLASHRSSNPLTQAGRIRTSMCRRWFGSFKLRRAAMLERQTSQKIAHFLLDFVCKQSVSGGQRSPTGRHEGICFDALAAILIETCLQAFECRRASIERHQQRRTFSSYLKSVGCPKFSGERSVRKRDRHNFDSAKASASTDREPATRRTL